MKKLSCGIIIRDPLTRKILSAHPTGHKEEVYDIPKGQSEEHEVPIDTAVRECFEETGLGIEKLELQDLGQYDYTKDKDLHLFYTEKRVDVSALKCTSLFMHETWHKLLPEVNKFAYFDLDEHKLYPALEKVIRKALEEHDLTS
jgi:predicted NUDIX family NTP pyrophosphohydrolase